MVRMLPAQRVDQHERHMGWRPDRNRGGETASVRWSIMRRATWILFSVNAILYLHARAANGQGGAGGTWGFCERAV